MFINCSNVLNIDYFCLIIIYLKCFLQWSIWWEGKGTIWSPGQLNVKTRSHLNYLSVLVFFWFSVCCCLFVFLEHFPLIWCFSIAIHTWIHHHLSSCVSECGKRFKMVFNAYYTVKRFKMVFNAYLSLFFS